jgi:hypothetical protein
MEIWIPTQFRREAMSNLPAFEPLLHCRGLQKIGVSGIRSDRGPSCSTRSLATPPIARRAVWQKSRGHSLMPSPGVVRQIGTTQQTRGAQDAATTMGTPTCSVGGSGGNRFGCRM